MEAKVLRELLRYNIWCNQRVFDLVKDLEEELFYEEVDLETGSIFLTLASILSFEETWIRRMLGEIDAKIEDFMCENKEDLYQLYEEYVTDSGFLLASLNDQFLKGEIVWNLESTSYSRAAWEIVLHIVTKSMNLRSQLFPILKAHGMNPPDLDFLSTFAKKPLAAI